MFERCVSVLAAVAALSVTIGAQAEAGCCPTCGCAVAVVEPVVVPVEPIYLVNKGPILSGPGHYLQGIGPYIPEGPEGPPAGAYPYVGFVYSGYPYGLQNSGGYPRGSYSPFTGYPYGDPPPKVVYRYHGVRRYPHYPR